MRIKPIVFTVILGIVLITGQAFGQGSLTPAGAPGETMRTLGQVYLRVAAAEQVVEPRTPITSAPYTISESGAYYLTTNLSVGISVNGITVATNNVSIDLNGFTLQGPQSGSGHGIYQSSDYTGLSIRNGKIVDFSGAGKCGIYAEGKSIYIQGVHVEDATYYAICAGTCATIVDCLARHNSSSGIYVDRGGTIERCVANYNNGHGISAGFGCVISKCSAYDNYGGHGIQATLGSTISDCAAFANVGDGISIGNDCLVLDNVCYGNGSGDGAGIHANGADNRIQDNHCTDNGRGIYIDMAGNFIVRNTCSGNTIQYDITGTQTMGAVISSTGIITNSNPWSNFEF